MGSNVVGIIIVNWNGGSDTIECLRSLKLLRKEMVKIHTYVIDNASSDNSIPLIKKEFPEITITQLNDNLGFCRANNIGIQSAYADGCDYIWLLNNDTVVDKESLSLCSSFRKDNVGIVGSKIYFYHGREYHKNIYDKKDLGHVIWYAGGKIDWANMYASHIGVDEVDHGQYNTEKTTEFITGCSMCLSRRVIEKVGIFDEKYFMYLEDLDYSLRAKKYGFSLIYNPLSMVWHKNAGSAGGSGSSLQEYYMTRNRLAVGLQYASNRTKIALFREAMSTLLGKNMIKRKAVSDFLMGKWGKQYG